MKSSYLEMELLCFLTVKNKFSCKPMQYLGSKLTQPYHCKFETSATI